jgi:hypothetical protein
MGMQDLYFMCAEMLRRWCIIQKEEVAAQLMCFAKERELRGVKSPRLEWESEDVDPVYAVGADARGHQESVFDDIIGYGNPDDVIVSSVSCLGVVSMPDVGVLVNEVSNLTGAVVVDNSVLYE